MGLRIVRRPMKHILVTEPFEIGSNGRSGCEPFAKFAAVYDAAVAHYQRERTKQILAAAGMLEYPDPADNL